MAVITSHIDLVSVPWRGLRSFGRGEKWSTGKESIGFPSPGGDYGLSDRSAGPPGAGGPAEFPSPGGDYGLSDVYRSPPLQGGSGGVSVPWRGLRSFGPTAISLTLKPGAQVSVPWRGLRSFGRSRCCPCWGNGSRFPSPGGDYGLSDFFMRLGDEGAYVTFPSPGGDYGLSDLELGSGFITKQNGFRPLAGITVFRTYGGHAVKSKNYKFPSPGGDYGLSDQTRPLVGSGPTSSFPSPGGDYGLSDL